MATSEELEDLALDGVVIACPNCGEELSAKIAAELPRQTDLTLSLEVEEGQFVRLDTISGVLASWRDLQIAVGKSMGADTEVFLVSMEHVGNRLSFTSRIVNTPSRQEQTHVSR